MLTKLGSLTLNRPSLADYISTREEFAFRANELFSWIAKGQIKISISKKFALKDASEAHRYLECKYYFRVT